LPSLLIHATPHFQLLRQQLVTMAATQPLPSLTHSTPHSQLWQQQLVTMAHKLHLFSVGEETSLNLGRGMWGTGLNSPQSQIPTCMAFTG